MKSSTFLKLIFPVIFNIIFFVMGGVEHNTSVWISWAFIHFAYIMLLLTPKFIHEGKSSAIFGRSLYALSGGYFLIEFIVGLAFIIIAPEGHGAAFIIQLIIAGIFGALFSTYTIANEHTAKAEEARQVQIDYVKGASARLKILTDAIDDKALRKGVERVYDVVSSSPVKTHQSLAEKENRILQSIDELEAAVKAGNNDTIASISASLLSLVNERNTLLKAF